MEDFMYKDYLSMAYRYKKFLDGAAAHDNIVTFSGKIFVNGRCVDPAIFIREDMSWSDYMSLSSEYLHKAMDCICPNDENVDSVSIDADGLEITYIPEEVGGDTNKVFIPSSDVMCYIEEAGYAEEFGGSAVPEFCADDEEALKEYLHECGFSAVKYGKGEVEKSLDIRVESGVPGKGEAGYALFTNDSNNVLVVMRNDGDTVTECKAYVVLPIYLNGIYPLCRWKEEEVDPWRHSVILSCDVSWSFRNDLRYIFSVYGDRICTVQMIKNSGVYMREIVAKLFSFISPVRNGVYDVDYLLNKYEIGHCDFSCMPYEGVADFVFKINSYQGCKFLVDQIGVPMFNWVSDTYNTGYAPEELLIDSANCEKLEKCFAVHIKK